MEESRQAERPAAGRWIAVLALITVAAAIPRLIAMRESLAWDELYLYALVHDKGLSEMFDAVRATEKTPPLGFALAWACDRIGGPPQLIRLPALAAGLALVPLTGALARRCFGPTAGLVAAGLVAASPALLFYSVEARSYSLATALVAGSTLALLAAVDRGSKSSWAAYSLLTTAALMSHYTVVSVLAVQFGWAAIVHRDRWRQLLTCQILPLTAALVWLPAMAEQVRNSSDELARLAVAAPLSFETLREIVERSLAGSPLVGLDRVPGAASLTAIGIGTLLAAGFAVSRAAAQPTGARRDGLQATTTMLWLTALAPLALALAVSLQPGQSMLLPRNILVGLPAALALIAALLTRPPRPFAIAACALVLGGLTVGSITALEEAKRPGARAAALAISERWRPGDRILDLCCILGSRGPLGTSVAINLPPDRARSLSVLARSGNGIYEEVLERRQRLFVIGSRLTADGQLILFQPPKAWRSAYRPAWSRSWGGVVGTEAIEYVPR